MEKIRLGDETPLRVLLAEDNKVNQVLTLGLLSCLGYSCDLAENGEQAIEASHRIAYDLILMDCQLPVIDGLEAAMTIRCDHPNLPIIAAYSANVTAAQRERYQAAGMQFVLAKPVTLESIKELMAKVVDSIRNQHLRPIASWPNSDQSPAHSSDTP